MEACCLLTAMNTSKVVWAWQTKLYKGNNSLGPAQMHADLWGGGAALFDEGSKVGVLSGVTFNINCTAIRLHCQDIVTHVRCIAHAQIGASAHCASCQLAGAYDIQEPQPAGGPLLHMRRRAVRALWPAYGC